MDMSHKAPVLAQYSSSCSPFEDDIFQNGSHEDEIGTFLQTELIVLSHTHTVVSIGVRIELEFRISLILASIFLRFQTIGLTYKTSPLTKTRIFFREKVDLSVQQEWTLFLAGTIEITKVCLILVTYIHTGMHVVSFAESRRCEVSRYSVGCILKLYY